MAEKPSVQNEQLVSDEDVRKAVREELYRVLHVSRSHSRAKIAADSRINIHTIDAWLTHDECKQRPISFGQALSLMAALGQQSVNSLLAMIGYVAQEVGAGDPDSPALVAAEAMGHVARFARCAADNRIDHTEKPEATDAVDQAIEALAPFSSKRAAG